MTRYEISYNLGAPLKAEFVVAQGEDVFTKFLTRLEQEGLTMTQIVNEVSVIIKNLNTGEKYQLNKTSTRLEKI